MIRISVDGLDPDPSAIARAADVVRRGGVVAVPTDTLYGLAADPFDPAAVDRVFTIKGRAAEQALPLIAADRGQVARWLGDLTPLAARLGDRFWPGPLTLVVAAPQALAAGVTGGGVTVGVRVPAHPVARALCAACARPLTATSANISGEPATSDPDAVQRTLGSVLDLMLDAGPAPGGPASTIVDVTGGTPRLIRAGAISWDEVQACVLGSR